MYRFLFLVFFLFPLFSSAQTNMQAGDIAFIGYKCNSNVADSFAIVFLKDIASSTQINFTDNGYQSGALTTNEGTISWTATSSYSKGDVLIFTDNSGYTASSGTVSVSGNFTLSTSGDQIIAYQGNSSSPTFLAAIQMNGNWDSSPSNTNESAIPSGLIDSLTCLSLSPERDNAYFSITTSSAYQKELLESINNPSNWTSSNNNQVWPNWSFSVSSCVEPSTAPSSISSSVTGNSITLSFTKGSNSTNTYIVFNTNNSFNDPTDNIEYVASNLWQFNGEQVVSIDALSSVTLYNLPSNTTFYYRLYSFNACGGWPNYLQSTYASGSVTTSSCSAASLAFQGFENSGDYWPYTVKSGSASASNSNSSSYYPASSQVKSGTYSLQNIDDNSIVTFNKIKNSSHVDRKITIYTSSISKTAGNGHENSDYIKFWINNTGNFSGTANLELQGNNNVKFGMDGTGYIDVDVSKTSTYTYSSGGTKTGDDAKSKIEIEIPDSWTEIHLQIELLNNDANEIWCIDDVLLSGICDINNSTFDNFNRTASNSISTPSSGGSSWTESESSSSNIAIVNNQIKLTSASSNGQQQAIYNMSSKYSTVLGAAASDLIWSFNMYQTRNDPSGFGSSSYGSAVVLACNTSDANSASSYGYAVVLGEAGSTDPIRLVSFNGGLSGTLNTIVSTGDYGTEKLNIKVNYNPCNHKWDLFVGDDGSPSSSVFKFSNPKSLSTSIGSAHNNEFIDEALNYFILYWNHGTNTSEYAVFDNISIPNQSADYTTYTFTASVDNDFNNSANWLPNRTCKKISDILSHSTGGSLLIEDINDDTLSQIILSNSSTLTLKPKTGGIRKLTLAGSTGLDLSIPSGSSLILDIGSANSSSDGVQLHLGENSTAQIDGSLVLQNSNSGTAGRKHRLTADKAASIQVNGTIEVKDLSGSLFDGSVDNACDFNSGSYYIAKDGSSPFGSSTDDYVSFKTGSNYYHQQSSIFSLANRTYSNVIIDYSGNVNFLFGSGSSSEVAIDDLTIKSGTSVNVLYSTNDMPLNWNIKGDIDVENNATLNFNPSSSAASTIRLNGNSVQEISGSGTLAFGDYITLEIDNSSDIELSRYVEMSGTLKLTDGNIILGSNDFRLIGTNNPSGSADSYIKIDGSGRLIRKISSGQTYNFPIGQNPYLPIQISCASCTGVDAEVGVIDEVLVDPTNSSSNTLAQAGHLNYVKKTWLINPSTTVANATVTPQWNASDQSTNPGNTNSSNDLGVGYWHSGVSTSWNNGTINSSTNASSGIYSLGRTFNLIANTNYVGVGSANTPLPIELISFNLLCDDDKHSINWQTATENQVSNFIIEGSNDLINFNPIISQSAKGSFNQGANYQISIGENESFKYYRLVENDIYNNKHFYNILENKCIKANINVLSSNSGVFIELINANEHDIAIYALDGRLIKKQKLFLGSNKIDVPKGLYIIHFKNESKLIKF